MTSPSTANRTANADELQRTAQAFTVVQEARILKRHGMSYTRALRSRDSWERRWERELTPIWDEFFGLDDAQTDKLIRAAQMAWPSGPFAPVQKMFAPRLLRALGSAVTAVIGSPWRFVQGAMTTYMKLATDTSEDAGQHTLDMLGMNQTFRWTTREDMPRNLFAIRGSKVLQVAHGYHLDRLQNIVLDATDPQHPQAQSEVKRKIRDEWSGLKKYQVERIARTETANAWTTTSVNTQLANDVRWFEISIAKGPSIGPPKSEPVCPICIKAAAGSPYPMAELPTVPLHPNCRCTVIPSLSHDWLPPAEPWNGNEPPLPLYPSPQPGEEVK